MPSPAFLVVQQREYRRHLIEVIDRGKAACAVVVRPPPSMGEAWEVVRADAAVTLAEMLERAKALIDAAMGPRPPQRPWHGGTRQGP
jgi:hypothetical protein